MTIDEAYIAMFLFLEHLYEMSHSDELGGLLGAMNLTGIKKTMDPAMWSDWEQAITSAPGCWKELQKTFEDKGTDRSR